LKAKKIDILRPTTWEGRNLLPFLSSTFFAISLFFVNEWSFPKDDFEEDAANMNLYEATYLGHKYYTRPYISPSDNTLIGHFKSQRLSPYVNSNIINSSIKINFGGDLQPSILINPTIASEVWSEIGDDYFDADIVVANLETPIDTTKEYSPAREIVLNSPRFNINSEIFDLMTKHKSKYIDVLSICNNHSADMGYDGILNTRQYLANKGISPVGVGKKPEDRIAIIERSGIKIAFIAYTYSLNSSTNDIIFSEIINVLPLNNSNVELSQIKADAEYARQKGAEFVILLPHFGNAYQFFPSKTIIQNARKMITECGIDAIFASHPHVLQPYEYIKGTDGNQKLIVYSMGDFVSFDIFNHSRLSAYYSLELSKVRISNGTNQIQISNFTLTPLYMYLDRNQDSKMKMIELFDNKYPNPQTDQITSNEIEYFRELYKAVFPKNSFAKSQ